MVRPPQMTGADWMVTERPPELWEVVKLHEMVAATAALEDRPWVSLPKRLFDDPSRFEDVAVTVGMVGLAMTEIEERYDPGRRPGRRLALGGGGAAPGPADTEGDASDAVLWAIRQSLSLAVMFISTAADPRGLAADLLDRRARQLDEHHRALIHSAAGLGNAACGTAKNPPRKP